MRPFNPKTVKQKIIAFLRKEFATAGFATGIIALSSGIDSTVATYLAAQALGAQNLKVLLLPYKNWYDEAITHAQLAIKALKIPAKNVEVFDIAPTVDAFYKKSKVKSQKSKVEEEIDKIRLGNVMARIRMIALYDRAKKHKALVVGTENRSEYYLGYFTRFGDEASDIEPIRALFKTEVYALGRYLGVPEVILNKAPTAGLWHGQTDEGQFGFTYKEADEILYNLFERPKSLKSPRLPKTLVKKIQAWVAANNFKHHLPKVFEL